MSATAYAFATGNSNGTAMPAFAPAEVAKLTHRVRETVFVVVDPATGRYGVAVEMANGIATTRLVIEMAKNGYLAFFGAAGLDRARVDSALDELIGALGLDGP